LIHENWKEDKKVEGPGKEEHARKRFVLTIPGVKRKTAERTTEAQIYSTLATSAGPGSG